jgi:hypothetical protein
MILNDGTCRPRRGSADRIEYLGLAGAAHMAMDAQEEVPADAARGSGVKEGLESILTETIRTTRGKAN